MKYFSLVIVLLLLSCKANNNTVQNPCSIDYLHTLKNADTLSDRKIFLFLKNYSNTACDNNVEYSQWKNELLFLLLANHTNQFLTQLDRISDKTKILEELASPVSDMPFQHILNKVEANNTYSYVQTKLKVIVALNTAMQKST